ncbi:hypothetical protein BH11ARM1_BH11ARM1_01550 [soil metagenome]
MAQMYSGSDELIWDDLRVRVEVLTADRLKREADPKSSGLTDEEKAALEKQVRNEITTKA